MSDRTCRLYLISPSSIPVPEAFAESLEVTLAAGDVAALQVRLKPANETELVNLFKRIRPIAHAHNVALILNDDPEMARRLDCDGVHLGQSDMPLTQARKLLGKDMMIGMTCHDSRHLAMEASEAGADYVAFGAFYPTLTKATFHRPEPEILSVWQETMQTPCVAIGGITVDNAAPLVSAGADFLAVSAGVWQHPEGPAAAVLAFNSLFQSI